MNLKELRESFGKSRQEVANALGISPQALSNYESGIRRIDIEQALKMARFFDVGAEEVIEAQLRSITIRKTN